MNVDETEISVSESESSCCNLAFKLPALTSKLGVLSASVMWSAGNHLEQLTSPSSSPKDHPSIVSARGETRLTISPSRKLKYSAPYSWASKL